MESNKTISSESSEAPIYDVYLKHQGFIEKFVGGGQCFCWGDDDYHNGHAYSFIEDQFDSESIGFIRRFENISNQTFIYLAEGPRGYFVDNYESKVGSEIVFLTCEGLNIQRSTDEDEEINLQWSDISSIENDSHSCRWDVYSKIDGKRKLVASFDASTLVGGNNNTNLKKWKKLFSELLIAAHNIVQDGDCANDNDCKHSSSNNFKKQETIKMKIDQTKIEYVIGIDLGHGETSAALCPVQWNQPVGQLDPVKDLELGGNKKVIPSAITILDNGNAYIGDSAFSPDILRNAQVHVCFKKKPKDINGEAEQIMIRFMSEVYKRIRENNSALLTDDNHIVYIASPSGWDKTAQNLYMEMAKKAGLPIAGITKESRAAFVRAQHDVTSGLGRNIDKGAIVFDMGSSTLDFTYMNKNLPNLVDNGYDCGASQVEKTIFKCQEGESEAIRMFEDKYPKLVDYLLFEARKVKEQVYFDTSLKVKKTINFDDFIEDKELEDERFKLVFNPGELDSLLEKTGYLKSIENAMLDYREKFIPGYRIYGVFLTGGASRMDFIKSLVCKCWKVEESQVYRDNDPSLTISQGVAEVARMDLRTDGSENGLNEEINNVINNNHIYEDFVESYGNNLYDCISRRVQSCIESFKDDDDEWTLYGLQQVIAYNVKEVIEEEATLASKYMASSIEDAIKPIAKRVEDIIREYSAQGLNLDVSKLNISVPQVSEINLDDVMEEISQRISEESSSWGGLIAGAAIGGVIGFLFPILGIIGGAVVLVKKLFFDEPETEEEKRDKAMSKLLSKSQREDIWLSLVEKEGELNESIYSSVFDALTSDDSIKQSVNKAVNELLNSYKENLRSARVLID